MSICVAMDRDLMNLKKWLKNLGLEADGMISDGELKKLVPPQRRDMWKNITKHVLPKEEVDLIKKSLLLHKLQKRQKPLQAIVESDEDLSNVLKYEELLTKYNKIQKEIIDVKINNSKLKNDLDEKYEHKKTVNKNIELKQSSSYLAKHKIEYYNKCIKDFNKFYNFSSQFSLETNENLTKTDYEDSLIKCFTEVDDAKENGTMKDSVNIGKQLCNSIYTTLNDKSPATLIKTIEDNLTVQINNSNEIINETKAVSINNDNETVIDELIKNFVQKQLELNSKLTSSLTEKENTMNHLKETINLVKNVIISQYKLKNISCSENAFLAFKENLKNTIHMVFKISIDCSKVVGFQENLKYDGTTLDDILQKTNTLNEEMDEKKTIVCEMLKELVDKKSDFGLMESKTVMDKLAEVYLTKIDDSNFNNNLSSIISSIKYSSSCDVNNINKLTIRVKPKSNIINFSTLRNITQCTEMIDVISNITTEFNQFNNTISTESKFNEISKKENLHKDEFDSFIREVENNMMKLDCIIEDSKTLADILMSKQLQNLPSSN